MYEMHKDRVQTGVVLILDNKDTSFIINEDHNRIMQVVTNLITNAIKFTFKGEIRFGFDVREAYIDFYVKDTGMGISEEKIKMIFEPVSYTHLDVYKRQRPGNYVKTEHYRHPRPPASEENRHCFFFATGALSCLLWY